MILPRGGELREKCGMKNRQSTHRSRKFLFPDWRGNGSSKITHEKPQRAEDSGWYILTTQRKGLSAKNLGKWSVKDKGQIKVFPEE